jgi:hypothetical protein
MMDHPMPRVRAMFWITTLLALVLVRPLHWGVHALGGHAACSEAVASVDQAHEGCTHDHGTDGASTSEHSSERAPVDGDDLADCELCLAIGLLVTDPVAVPLQVPQAVPSSDGLPSSTAQPICSADHPPLQARPPPTITT